MQLNFIPLLALLSLGAVLALLMTIGVLHRSLAAEERREISDLLKRPIGTTIKLVLLLGFGVCFFIGIQFPTPLGKTVFISSYFSLIWTQFFLHAR